VTQAIVAFGANLGDPARMFENVERRFEKSAGVKSVRISSLYRTVPVGGPSDQPAFINAALAVESSLDANAFFSLMRLIETDLGRERKEAWGPRSIDLDLVLFGKEVYASATLTTPHPRMHFRRFVLAPTAEIAPTALHPLLGIDLDGLHRSLAELTNGKRLLAVVGDHPAERTQAVESFQKRFAAAKVVALPPESIPGTTIDHGGAIIGVRPSVHLPGVEDRRLEHDLDRIWEAADEDRLWIATSADFQPGLHPVGDRVVSTVDLRAANPEQRKKEFAYLLESLAEPEQMR
jgi:2-amino-4-hydroxy-6-hydroxymethyldihydropteridine diphosphokinase